MAKFAIECPHCGRVNTASTFFLAKKVINCGICHQEINVKQSRLVSRVCPNEECKSVFVFDQGKPREDCPVCGTRISRYAVKDEKDELVQVVCPQCSCAVEVSGKTEWFNCPVCDLRVDGVQKIVARQKLVKNNSVSVIKYEGDNTTFVWKHPIEDFNFGSQLIVHESQEAIFFLNGQALDSFGPGRYSLETGNLPILKNAYKLPADGTDLFHAEVYFINKTVHMGMKWGTDSRVRFIDPVTGIPLDIGASGELNLQVENGRKLLVKLVGTTGGIKDKDVLTGGAEKNGYVSLQSYFRAPLMTAIKSQLATAIKDQNINILEMDQHMSALSDALRDRISPDMEEYGLVIPQFYITNISLPEDDKNFQNIKALIAQAYIKVKEQEVAASVAKAEQEKLLIQAQTEAQVELIKAQAQAEAQKMSGFAEAEVMRAKGYNQKDVLQADVQKAYAEGIGNMGGSASGGGGGNIAADLIGVMAGMKIAGGVVDNIGNVVSEGVSGETKAPVADTWECSCGEKGNTKNFCMNCGAAKPELWDCSCGEKGIKGKFCPECGKAKTVVWDCPQCGAKNNKGKFCSECGYKKGEE